MKHKEEIFVNNKKIETYAVDINLTVFNLIKEISVDFWVKVYNIIVFLLIGLTKVIFPSY